MGTIFFELALTLYFAGFILSIVGIIRKKNDLDKAVFFLSLIGFILHTVYLIIRYIKSGQAPVFSMHEANSYFAWSILLVSFLISFSYKVKVLNFGIILSFLIMFIGAFFPRGIPSLKPEIKSFWIDIHAVMAIFGIALFSLAFVFSSLYLIQEKAIKSKKFRGFESILPNLEILDKINYHLIFWGFPLYTIALVVGFIKYVSLVGFMFDPKEIWSFLTWIVYLSIYYLRVKEDWRKKKAAYLTILAFLLVIFGFFGINLLTESFHKPL
ncbi:MAG: cytochrome c biogenesis protein [Thermodesulfovibrio sp.]|nr:cytochrome c biogenesis protein [Thermodesulfovibrio sp.]MCX7724151.1 cytochrome c biogenesis protein [Thermodesulfovibrio sp.]MDW7971825.1 cytochrome c biogenesis protein CcsA [Thermodesulfovibrio sp.]